MGPTSVRPVLWAITYTFRRWLIQVLLMGLVSWSRQPPSRKTFSVSQLRRHLETSRTEDDSVCWGLATFSMASRGQITASHSCSPLEQKSSSRRSPLSLWALWPRSPLCPRGCSQGAGIHGAATQPLLSWHWGPTRSAGMLAVGMGRAELRRSWSYREVELGLKRGLKEAEKQMHT